MPIPKNDGLLDRARELRQEMTPQERRLWYTFLRRYPVKFYKQRIIGPYIVDFYCARAKLVIEVDGGQHYEENWADYDAARTAYLTHLGLSVVRYSNADMNRRFKRVCEDIDLTVKCSLAAENLPG